jgi:hypothetical protein
MGYRLKESDRALCYCVGWVVYMHTDARERGCMLGVANIGGQDSVVLFHQR